MTEILTGLQVPDFSASSTGGKTFRLSALKGHPLVLYFYPRDNTPGCTEEGRQFAALYGQFRKVDCEIFGISRDNLRSHENFKSKMQYPFDLLSDEDERVCNMFDVIKMKNMYGKQVRGIERSTFVIDAGGTLVREWRGVKVPGHGSEVLDFLKSL
jgi:peroxiredoxin Q/BCP